MTDKIIVTEDILLKAAIRFNERKGGDLKDRGKFFDTRNEMSDLCEKILALRDVGALPNEGKIAKEALKGKDNASN